MHDDAVVGIIGGQGWMGRSLGVAWLEQGLLPPERLVISSRSGRNEAYRDWPEVRCVEDSRELAELVDVIVLSVRPQDLPCVDIDAGDKLVISLLAMASCEEVANRVGSRRVVRAMPNAAAEIRRAYFPWYASEGVSDADRRLVQAVLASCGAARELPTEGALDYLTALSGAGPAYPALLAQSMLDHARQMGIADDVAREAVMQTLVGGSLLLESLDADPGEMVERLVAYDGTTAKGLRAMIDGGMVQAIHQGLEAAHQAASESR
ncbi:pyrroline-5-carboxylate reductase family protein [Halomonas cerina]|uniref:Pyrroline-5-carboxylate reductase n=1 Tax=Halomonas cerina TaxID=447424 RepID=A0A839VCL6_9GAMM|nr:pyrroline-5-carboxylate reductase dimerization domain-containing protein [Halomonas cerina]MBB3190256.1 pyrroline-5-carboxylate reductase [Halomonas cerina]